MYNGRVIIQRTLCFTVEQAKQRIDESIVQLAERQLFQAVNFQRAQRRSRQYFSLSPSE